HTRNGARECPDRAAVWCGDLRRVRGRSGRLSVRARRCWKPGHGRPALHARWTGDRNGRIAGTPQRSLSVHRLEDRSPAPFTLRPGCRKYEVRSTKSDVRPKSVRASPARVLQTSDFVLQTYAFAAAGS